jgi:DNA-binding response OmpR family regulator
MQVPSSSLPPQADVETQVSEMTKRYGLSNDQATKVRAILKDEEQKADAILKDSSLPPPAIFSQMRTIREDETTRVSAVLTAEQQKKYQADVKQMQGPPSQAPGGFPPPPGFPGGSSSN